MPRVPAGGGGEHPALPLPGGGLEGKGNGGGKIEVGQEPKAGGGRGPRLSLSLGTGWRPGPPISQPPGALAAL